MYKLYVSEGLLILKKEPIIVFRDIQHTETHTKKEDTILIV